jgi:hypothetical protein
MPDPTYTFGNQNEGASHPADGLGDTSVVCASFAPHLPPTTD